MKKKILLLKTLDDQWAEYDSLLVREEEMGLNALFCTSVGTKSII